MEEINVPMTALEARRAEVAAYRSNIAMYKTILESLPTEWPEHLVQFKGAVEQHKAAASIEDLDDLELVAKLWYADQCKAAIRAETVEMTKAAAILATMEAQEIAQ